MGLMGAIIVIYAGGPIGILCLLIGLVQIGRKKTNSATIWLFIGGIVTAIAVLMFRQLSQVNFSL